jgi:hypothetical protein
MEITGSRKILSLYQVCLEWPAAAWTYATAGSGVLALIAFWIVGGSCWAAEALLSPPATPGAAPVQRATVANNHGNNRLDIVIVEPQDRGPWGFRYRVVLDSVSPDGESALELFADEDGLVVTARDVDGIGNNLDLIIKGARSFTPVGVWINDHHGGFTKADVSIYAPSIWTERSFMLSVNPPDTLRGAILLWHESYIHPSPQPHPGERRARQGLSEWTDLDVASRLATEPSQTRGPPVPFLAPFSLILTS